MVSQNYQGQMDEKQVTDTLDTTIEKRKEGANGSVLIDVPHITDWLPQATVFPNDYAYCKQTFVEEDDVVYKEAAVKLTAPHGGIYFRRAGPRAEIYFRPDEVRACIVTCGSLSSGLNTVIREIVCGLWTQYGVREIIGIDGGFRGFYSRNTIPLSPRVVDDIHKRGGTFLGTSFGGFDTSKIVNSIIDRHFNQVYIIGGDGAQRGAKVIYEELRKRGLKTTVAGIPKTSDNDIAVIDKAVGFETAVEEAQRAINAAHTEAQSARNGIGLVKLMGRHSGEIAVHATLASRDVDICLIPEAPFYLDGKGGFYEFVQSRLRENGHMVIVVAEGAGQDLMEGSLDKTRNGSDIGLWLSQKIKDYFAQRNVVVNLKYIDPTYMIRAIPSNASENIYCTLLAHSAVHGSMAGYSGYTVGPINGRHAYIPFHIIIDLKRRVNTADEMWAKLLSSTNQPNFLKA